jgi:hypothetical protein
MVPIARAPALPFAQWSPPTAVAPVPGAKASPPISTEFVPDAVVPTPLLSVSVPKATAPEAPAATLVPQAVDSAVPLSTAPLAPAGFSVLSHLNADAGTGISAAVKAIMELTSSAVRQENNGCDIGTAPCEHNPPDILSLPGDRQPSFAPRRTHELYEDFVKATPGTNGLVRLG